MKLVLIPAGLILLTAGTTWAGAAPLKETGVPVSPSETHVSKDKASSAPISERFPSLDAYLAYLEKRSHMDGPWYRLVGPGLYELQTGNLRLPDGAREKRTFTREELERRFGFAR